MNFEQNKKKLIRMAELWRADELFKVLLTNEVIKDNEKRNLIINLSAQNQFFSKEISKGSLDIQEKRKIVGGIMNGVVFAIDNLEETDYDAVALNRQLLKVKLENIGDAEEKLSITKWLFPRNLKTNFTIALLAVAFILFFFNIYYCNKNSEIYGFAVDNLTKIGNSILQIVFTFFAMHHANAFRRFDTEIHKYGENEEEIKNRFLPNKSMDYSDWVKFKNSANLVVRRFVDNWYLSWGAWLALYILITIRLIIENIPDSSIFNHKKELIQGIWILQDFCKNYSTYTFFLMFYVLTSYVANEGEDKQKIKSRRWNNYAVLIASFFLIFEVLCWDNPEYSFVIRLITSMLAGVMLMLVFARLTSKIIALPILGIVFMCFYAVLQPLYAFLNIDELHGTVKDINDYTKNISLIIDASLLASFTLLFAFLLKATFFLIVTWTLRTGRMLHLVAELRTWDQIRHNYYNEFVDNVPTTIDE